MNLAELKNLKFKSRKMIILVLFCYSGVVLADTMEQELLRCSYMDNDDDRLVCYDRLVVNSVTNKDSHFIQPDAQFLSSELRVRPEVADFKLSVADFLQLLSKAQTEDGERINIKGWSSVQDRYVLHVDFRKPLQLLFSFDSKHPHFSILHPVGTGDFRVNATQFIYTIAAMTP